MSLKYDKDLSVTDRCGVEVFGSHGAEGGEAGVSPHQLNLVKPTFSSFKIHFFPGSIQEGGARQL